jgi:hypothetical protein
VPSERRLATHPHRQLKMTPVLLDADVLKGLVVRGTCCYRDVVEPLASSRMHQGQILRVVDHEFHSMAGLEENAVGDISCDALSFGVKILTDSLRGTPNAPS